MAGQWMWIGIIVLIILMFGGSKIPELMRGVGRGVGELQKGLHEGKEGIKKDEKDEKDEKEEKEAK
jgi:sec-independent protein translocase protein TatA